MIDELPELFSEGLSHLDKTSLPDREDEQYVEVIRRLLNRLSAPELTLAESKVLRVHLLGLLEGPAGSDGACCAERSRPRCRPETGSVSTAA